MPAVNIVIEGEAGRSMRCRQLEALFDVPAQEKCRLEWKGDFPFEDSEWNVGLIVGPSGSGKTTIAKNVFGENYHKDISWGGGAVIDDFAERFSMQDISMACSAVGFNTIPAWVRPYKVLSTGEKFRVELARRILELDSPIVVDEFTSVVDRQIAKIGANSVQKFIRKNKKQFVAVSCHYDIIDWLQPDWTLEPGTMCYRPRGLLQRPKLEAVVRRCGRDLWSLFAPYHYMSADIHKGSKCFALLVDGHPVSFAAVLHVPNNRVNNIWRLHRVVTLPDWQGLGIVFTLGNILGAAYKAIGQRLRAYPAHPALIQSLYRSDIWSLKKKPGYVQKVAGHVTAKYNPSRISRPGAVFEYAGDRMDKDTANQLING